MSDLISREDLIKAIKDKYDYASATAFLLKMRDILPQDVVYQILTIIDSVPTVIVDNCGKCPYYKDRDRDIITEAYNDGYKTAKEEFESHKLVNNSQELVKDLVKEKSERPNFMTATELENAFICGYRVKDLIVLGKLFHDNGITREQLIDSSESFLAGYRKAYEEINDAIKKTVNSIGSKDKEN